MPKTSNRRPQVKTRKASPKPSSRSPKTKRVTTRLPDGTLVSDTVIAECTPRDLTTPSGPADASSLALAATPTPAKSATESSLMASVCPTYLPAPRSGPQMFSTELPSLQLAWDSTSLRTLQKCARLYQYQILDGYRGSAIDLEFGGFYAAALAEGRKVRALGGSRDEAQLASVTKAVRDTWLPGGTPVVTCFEDGPSETEVDMGRPWGGFYAQQWRCTGESAVAYRNKAGNRAKCPYSHKGVWHPCDGPAQCGECGSSTESARNWVPHDAQKDRYGLIRAVCWYWEEQPLDESSGMHTVLFPNGTPAVELSFRLPTGFKFGTEDFIISGHLDAVKGLGIRSLAEEGAEFAELLVTDDKTTRKTLAPSYFDGYSPDTQTDLYDFAASLLFKGYNIKGVAIDGAQVLAEGARFLTQPLYRTEAHREEFYGELEYWFSVAQGYAQAGHWPMNRSACWLCPMKSVCSKPPADRKKWALAAFEVKPWNPLVDR